MQAMNVSGPEGESVQGDPKVNKVGPGKMRSHIRCKSYGYYLVIDA